MEQEDQEEQEVMTRWRKIKVRRKQLDEMRWINNGVGKAKQEEIDEME